MNISTKISAALAVAAISAAFMTYSTSANASSLRDTCIGKTRSAVQNCCETWTRRNGTPIWMMGAGCHAASISTCRGGGGGGTVIALKAARVAPMLCYNQQITLIDKGSKDTPPPPSRGRAN